MFSQRGRKKLPSGVLALGFVSLFMDISSEIVHGLLPVFLVSVLGANMTTIGILEGLAEAVVLVVKTFSGPMSDIIGRRKPLVVLGYAMGALSKPMFAIAGSVSLIYAARIFDRFGKGIRGAPRDALVADITPQEIRGRAFGLRQSMDTVGAFTGPILAIAFMYLFSDQFRTVFWIATIPGLLSVATAIFFVKEQSPGKNTERRARIHFRDLNTFPRSFWLVVIAGSLFQLARFSEAFLILRAKDMGLELAFAPSVLIAMNIVYAATAYPIGHISDRIGKEWMLLAGLLVLCVSDLFLAYGYGLIGIFSGIILWGLHMGLTQGTLGALVADTSPSNRRGTAYGIYNLFSAMALMLASVIAGMLWEYVGPSTTFIVGSGFSIFSFVLLMGTKKSWDTLRG